MRRRGLLQKFYECLQKELPKLSDGLSILSDAEKAVLVSRNLRSLLSHAESLIPGFLNEKDVQFLRVFIDQLESLLKPAQVEENQVQEVQNQRGCSSPQIKEVAPNLEQSPILGATAPINHPRHKQEVRVLIKTKISGAATRGMHIVGTSGSDSSPVRGKKPIELIDGVEPAKENELAEVKGDEKMETVQYEERSTKGKGKEP